MHIIYAHTQPYAAMLDELIINKINVSICCHIRDHHKLILYHNSRLVVLVFLLVGRSLKKPKTPSIQIRSEWPQLIHKLSRYSGILDLLTEIWDESTQGASGIPRV